MNLQAIKKQTELEMQSPIADILEIMKKYNPQMSVCFVNEPFNLIQNATAFRAGFKNDTTVYVLLTKLIMYIESLKNKLRLVNSWIDEDSK